MNIFEVFKNPPEAYSPAPLWFWYGKLEKEKISWQIDQMVDKSVYNAFMHPRAYLVTRYLEDEWWDIIGHTIEYSKKAGFRPWIYDEFAWPSGTAGSTFMHSDQKPSRVLAKGEVNMAKGLRYRYQDFIGPDKIESVFSDESDTPVSLLLMQLNEKGNIIDESITSIAGTQWNQIEIGSGQYRIMAFYKIIMPTHVDYLNENTIKDFISFTHEEYRKRYGALFGSLVPGVYFDEIYNVAKPIVWTESFSEKFLHEKGYDIKLYLPLLIFDGEEQTDKVRMDYFDTLTLLYEKAFFLQISKWCEQNGLMLTGHTEEWIQGQPLRQGNYFKTMRHLQIPGADCHDYRYTYPRKITPTEPKDAVSIARLYGKQRCMSESMGGGGWATPLQEFKRGVNVLAAMGINMFILHGFYYENDHQGSQCDWPTSFFFQNPYWKYFSNFSKIITRLSYINSMGKPVVDIGIFYPIKSVQINYKNGMPTEAALRISENYHKVLDLLVKNQIDADFVDEDSIVAAHVENGQLVMGEERFSVLLIPDSLYAGESCVHKLKEFSKSGGQLIIYTCGNTNGGSIVLEDTIKIDNIETRMIPEVNRVLDVDCRVINGAKDELFYNHRIIEGKDFYLITNACDKARDFMLRLRATGDVYLLDIETGERKECRYTLVDDRHTDVMIRMQEDEAVYIVFDVERSVDLQETVTTEYYSGVKETIQVKDQWNVLPLSKKYDNEWGIDDTETELKIPIAEFRSDLQPQWQTIRICNRLNEAGSCRRYLSNWRASWITRRCGWGDNSNSKTLYFRKKIILDSAVVNATICIDAVERFEFYVNGSFIASGCDWRMPAQVDITQFLQEGENLLAFKVENDHLYPYDNVLEFECLPPNLTSLLVQGLINLEHGAIDVISDDSWITCDVFHSDWNQAKESFEADAIKIDVNHKTPRPPSFKKWLYSWMRGTPPLLPWGSLPLFEKYLKFPRDIEYSILIPMGTQWIGYPDLKGEHSIFLDNKLVDGAQWQDKWLKVEDSSRTHRMNIKMHVKDYDDGMLYPIKLILAPLKKSLHDWCEDGFQWFSGRMSYKTEIILNEVDPNERYTLDLGKVNFHVEVWINGKMAGVRIWKPYQVDITDFVENGVNQICIVASNLEANEVRYNLVDEGKALAWNRYWNEDNIERDSMNLISGLLGPVTLKRYRI